MEEENHEEVVKSFEELGVCEPLIEACTKLGWITPTQIQAQAIPHALQGKDIIGLAETGSGFCVAHNSGFVGGGFSETVIRLRAFAYSVLEL